MTSRQSSKIMWFFIGLILLSLFFLYEIYNEKSLVKAIKKHPSIVVIMIGGSLMIMAILRAN